MITMIDSQELVTMIKMPSESFMSQIAINTEELVLKTHETYLTLLKLEQIFKHSLKLNY